MPPVQTPLGTPLPNPRLHPPLHHQALVAGRFSLEKAPTPEVWVKGLNLAMSGRLRGRPRLTCMVRAFQHSEIKQPLPFRYVNIYIYIYLCVCISCHLVMSVRVDAKLPLLGEGLAHSALAP